MNLTEFNKQPEQKPLSVAEQIKAKATSALKEGTMGTTIVGVVEAIPISSTKGKKGYWIYNHPYKFTLASSKVLKPDSKGQYHPENDDEKREFDHQVKKGIILFLE